MSHYMKIKTKIKSQDSLVKALCKMGYKENQIEVHEEATCLYGYQGDARKDKANIIIRRKNVGSMSNDIGYRRTEDGTFEAVISQYDSNKHNKAWQEGVEMHYGVEQTKKAFHQYGWQYEEKTNDKGQVVLVGQHY